MTFTKIINKQMKYRRMLARIDFRNPAVKKPVPYPAIKQEIRYRFISSIILLNLHYDTLAGHLPNLPAHQ